MLHSAAFLRKADMSNVPVPRRPPQPPSDVRRCPLCTSAQLSLLISPQSPTLARDSKAAEWLQHASGRRRPGLPRRRPPLPPPLPRRGRLGAGPRDWPSRRSRWAQQSAHGPTRARRERSCGGCPTAWRAAASEDPARCGRRGWAGGVHSRLVTPPPPSWLSRATQRCWSR